MLEKFAHTEVHVDVQDKDPEEKKASVAVDGNGAIEEEEEDIEEEDDEDDEELDEEQMVKDLVDEEGGEDEDDEEEDDDEDDDDDEEDLEDLEDEEVTSSPPSDDEEEDEEEEDDEDEDEDVDEEEEEEDEDKKKYARSVPEGVVMRETELRQVLGIGYADNIDTAIRRLSYQRMEFASYEGRIQRLEATNAALRWDNRVQYLEKEVESLSTLPGTSRENAEKLIRLEEAGQPELAKELLGSWQDIEQKNKQLGSFTARLSSREASGNTHPLENKMQDWADKQGKSVAEAYAHFQQNEPVAWRDFRTSIRNGNN
jgi:hypothetical protein